MSSHMNAHTSGETQHDQHDQHDKHNRHEQHHQHDQQVKAQVDAQVKALVTGGAGFIGFSLSRHLAEQGYHVTIMDNFARGKEDAEFHALLQMSNVRFVQGDITDPKTFDQLDDDYDYVYHLAAIRDKAPILVSSVW